MDSSSCQHLSLFSSQLAEVEKQQLLKQQQNQKNSKTVRELERINRVSTEAELLSNVTSVCGVSVGGFGARFVIIVE